jgi:hypothetical protein
VFTYFFTSASFFSLQTNFSTLAINKMLTTLPLKLVSTPC